MPNPSDVANRTIARCPHCGNEVGVELSPSLRYRCRICGGPRVPVVLEGVQRSHREAGQLSIARRSRRSELLFGALWIVAGTVGGVSFLLTFISLLLFSGLLSAWASLLVFPAVPLLLAWWSRRRALAARNAKVEALDNAWASVAHEILDQKQDELTSADLARWMLTDENETDRLLARLNVDDQVRSRITDDGEVTYSVRSPGRVRVSAEPGQTLLETLEDVEIPKAPRLKL